jgi:hypothetical protein
MAIPIKGAFRERFSVPYAGPQIWGTGYNLVHMDYGSPPDRQGALNPREGDVTPPFAAVPQQLIPGEEWGYTPDDAAGSGLYYNDDRPHLGDESAWSDVRATTGDQPPVNATGAAKTRFRAAMEGAYSTWRGKLPRANYMIPTETVSEGWVNKPHGRPANAVISDPSQYEMQTSVQQRYRARNNDLAVLRETDAPRSHINSRVTGQKIKEYSQGERLYDMFPKQQSSGDPRMWRTFWYRTAGVGIEDQMLPNEQWDISAVERTPPPDPYIGPQDTSLQYGYTPEDNFYA